jgi:hypothetical protein
VVQAKSFEDKQAWVKAINEKMSDQVRLGPTPRGNLVGKGLKKRRRVPNP